MDQFSHAWLHEVAAGGMARSLVTAATLAEQVVIARLLSAALAYHFGFLAISVAVGLRRPSGERSNV